MIEIDPDLGHFWITSSTNPSWQFNKDIDLGNGIIGWLTEHGMYKNREGVVWAGCGLFKGRAEEFSRRLKALMDNPGPDYPTEYERLFKDIPTPYTKYDKLI